MSVEEALKPLLGVWKCDNSRTENFEEFLQEMGVNFVIRKLAKRGSPTITISIQEENYHVKSDTGFMTQIMSYPVDGSVIDEEYRGGGKARAHVEVRDGVVTVVADPTDGNRKQTIVTRELVNGELVQKINVGNGVVICTRYFVRAS